MFKELHAMAKDAMLLITATAEGDQLRVTVTPTYPEGKVPAGAAPLRPLSVIASPDELDADFAAVLEFWKAPKRTLLEQAQDAASGSDDDADSNASSKPTDAQPKVRIAAKPADAQSKSKASRKPKADAAAGSAALGPAVDGAGEGEGAAETFALTGAETSVDAAPAAEPVAEPEPAPDAAPVDTFTIDLF